MSGSTLFVGNLSWQATEEDLKKAFPTATAVRIVMGDGRPKGYGYAEFASPEEARRAMDQNQHLEIEGRPVRLDFATPREHPPRGSPIQSPQQQNPPSTTLFVGNLSFDTTNESLKAVFPTCKSARVVYDRETQRSRGFGYVEFESVAAARAANEAMNGKEIDGRVIRIDYATSQASPAARQNRQPTNPPSTTIFLGNLSYECDEEAIRAAFADCGEIKSLRLMKDDAGASKGFGYIEFADFAASAAAIRKDNMELCGRNVHLDYAQPRIERAPVASSPRAPTNPPSSTLFLGGLSYKATTDDIRAAFNHFGTITDVRITIDRDTSRPKGFGYVSFSTVEEAQAALSAMNGQLLADRPLRLDFATPRSPGPRRERAPREDREEKERKPRRK